MNQVKKYSKMGFLVLLLAVFAAGCGSSKHNDEALSSAKAITEYSINGSTGIIHELTTPKTIMVYVPYGTSRSSLIAKFKTTGTSVKVDGVVQTSDAPPANDFTNPVIYEVIAEDASKTTYTVTVTESLASSKSIYAYSIAGQVSSSITGTAIAVSMPYGTPSVTALVATFSTSGAFVTVGTTTQESGTTPNNFTSPVNYTVHATDGSTTIYRVTVTVALNSAKAITAYSIASQVSSTIIASSITVTMPYSTPSVTNLVATFSTTGASVSVGTSPLVTQVSGSTPNNFTNPVVYTVHAANGSTATYTVTVHVAAAPDYGLAGPSPNIGTASTYGIFASSAAVGLAVDALVNGDVGLNPADACNNCVVGTTIIGGVIHNGDQPAIDAQVDIQAAYDEASVRSTNACPVSGDLSAAQADCTGYSPSTPGPIYGPGLYRTATTITLSGTMTLDAGGNPDAVFIFQTNDALTTGSNSNVVLTGSAQAKNVWWIVGSAATLGVSSDFKGTVIALGAAVTVLGGTDLDRTLVEGRLFSLSAAADVNEFATVTVPLP